MEYDDLQQIIKKMKSESESADCDTWSFLPENVLTNIFRLLSARDILNCSECCKRWHFVSRDSLLWRSKFREDFKVDRAIRLKPSE
jgi:hypothetical protein